MRSREAFPGTRLHEGPAPGRTRIIMRTAMSRIKVAFAGFVVGLAGLWFLADSLPIASFGQKAFDVPFTQLSGILAIGMMSLAVFLSIRPRWLEPTFDGLDKMYRLHKWLGVGGLLAGLAHWALATGGGRGQAAPQAAGAAAAASASAQTGLESLHGLAHGVGQPALFALIAFVVIALLTVIPYRIFAKTHFLVAFVYAVLAFHSVVLMKAAYWTQPVGWATIGLVAIGSISAVYALLRLIGLRKLSHGTVASAHYYPELRVLETELTVDESWPGHEAGQFAFVTTDWKEGPHPFTIATAWDPNERRIGFIAKELGDHTARLRDHFVAGGKARIEGPYGRFAFDDGKARQIWVGAGIGITPFVAKMRERAKIPDDTVVDLFHATSDVSETALAKMRADAEAAKVTLHIFVSGREGKLDAEKIRAAAPDWKSASLWFCGPAGFGAALKRDFKSAGLLAADFHQELFAMR
jgi:predicted ferric reductase